MIRATTPFTPPPVPRAPLSPPGRGLQQVSRLPLTGRRGRWASPLLALIAAGAPIVAGCSKGSASRWEAPAELLSAASAFPPSVAELPPAVPLEPLLAANQPSRLTVLEPSPGAVNLSRGTPLVVRFNRPMVEMSRVGKIAETPVLEFSPKVLGKLTWTSRSTLSFEAAPNTWAHSHSAELLLAPELRSLAEESIADFPARTVVFDASPHLAEGPRSETLMPGEAIQLLFDGNVETTELAEQMLVYEVDGGRRAIPFAVTARPRNEQGRIPVDVRLQKKLDPGSRVAVALAPRLADGGSAPRVVEVGLASRAQVEGIGCPTDAKQPSDCEFQGPPGRVVDIGETLGLVASVALEAPPKGALQITPELPGATLVLEESKRLLVRGDWAPGQVYKVALNGLKDEGGHALAEFIPLAVRSRGRAPEVRLATGLLTLERDGSPNLSFSAIHVENGEVRVASVPPGSEAMAALTPSDLIFGAKAGPQKVTALLPLVPTSRPNRWARGSLNWRDLGTPDSTLAVISLVPDKAAEGHEKSPAALAQWTDIGLDAKLLRDGVYAWATSLQTGKPIPGARVSVLDPAGKALASGLTDGGGGLWLGTPAGAISAQAVVVASTTADPAHQDRAVVVVDPRRGIGFAQLGASPSAESGEGMPVISMFTDRGVCRPGETIRVKTILRTPSPQGLKAGRGRIRLTLKAPDQEAPEAERELTVEAFGTAATEFAIDSAAPPGEYRVEAWQKGQAKALGVTQFTVGDYRPPMMRVDLSSDAPDYVDGDPLTAQIAAQYLFGASASGARVNWSLTREPGSSPPGPWDQFRFSPIDSRAPSGTADAGDGLLDGEGKLKLQSLLHSAGRTREKARIEVSIQDASGRSTSARLAFNLRPAAFEVGLQELPDWLDAGAALEAKAIVVNGEGAPQAGRTIQFEFVREAWHSWWQWSSHAQSASDPAEEGQYQSRKAQSRAVSHRCTVASGAAPVDCRWVPDRPGTYLVKATTQDDKGRISLASERVYVAGPDEHPDRDAPGTAITLTPSRRELKVGETAEIAFESPFPDAQALVQVHRNKVFHTQVLRVGAGGSVVRIPISAEMVPNGFVTVGLVRPRTGAPGKKLDLDSPDWRVGMTELEVRPAAAPLTVELKAPESPVQAGTDVAVEVQVRDASQHPAQAEVTLYAVDEGTLRLTGYTLPTPGESYFPRLSPPFTWEDLRRSLVSRVSVDLLPGPGGDQDGSADHLAPDNREHFDPTPLWMPRLITDPKGTVRATFHTPKRPTQYRIMAIAVGKGIETGQAERTLIATRGLVLRPTLPAFVRVGDRFEAAVFVHNTETTPLDAQLSLSVDGQARPPHSLHVPPGGEIRIGDWVEAKSAAAVDLSFSASAGSASSGRLRDAVQQQVPVKPRGRAVHASLVGAVPQSKELEVKLPEGSTTEANGTQLVIANHPFLGFALDVAELESMTWEGVEPIASTVIGLAAYDSLDAKTQRGALPPAELRARAEKWVKRLEALQTSSGGFGMYDRDDSPDSYLSAHAVHSLCAARARGWKVSEAALSAGSHYLEALVQENGFQDGGERQGSNDLAYALRALNEAGHPAREAIKTLFEERERLSPFGLAQLALSLGPKDNRRDGLIQDALKRILTSKPAKKKDEPELLPWYDTSTRTLGAVLEAAATFDPAASDAGRLASLLLKSRGEQGSWDSSYETSHALAGLGAYARRLRGEAPSHFQTTVTLDGHRIEPQQVLSTQQSYALPMGQSGGSAHGLKIETSSAAWYSLASTWIQPLGPKDTIARGETATLHRVLETSTGLPLESGAQVQLGDLVRVRLFVYSEGTSPSVVALRDPLAGGLEPLEEGFETTPRDALGTLLGMGPDEYEMDARGETAQRSLSQISHRAHSSSEVVFYLGERATGLREFTYGVRATTVGTFVLPPAELEGLYVPGFVARSASTTLTVHP